MTAILIQLLAGFLVAFMGVIILFDVHVWTGLLITLVGMFFVLRAGHRINKCN